MYQVNSYIEAKTLEEAIELLVNNENAQIIAGGTDVLIKTRERKSGYIDRDLIGIMRIPEINRVYLDDNGNIVIGSTASFTEVEENELIKKLIPSLSTAVGSVGGPQIRNMGTVGGNVANGATSADSASTLFALDAIVRIVGKKGMREVPVTEFYLGPGKVVLEKDEVIVGFLITKENYEGYKGNYIKYSHRKAMDIATLGCSIMIKVKNNVIEGLKIAYGVAGPTPLRAKTAEEYGVGKELSQEVLDKIGELCLEDTKARDSWRASKAFREQLIRELPKRAINIALGGGYNA